MRLLTLPDWNEKLLDLLFDPDSRSYGKGIIEYDALVDGVMVFSHLDGDLARLLRFREAAYAQADRLEVLCFPDQVPLLREYLDPPIKLKTIDMNSVEEALGLSGRSVFE